LLLQIIPQLRRRKAVAGIVIFSSPPAFRAAAPWEALSAALISRMTSRQNRCDPSIALTAPYGLALLKDGVVTKKTMIEGLSAISEELRKNYGLSARALVPIEDLILQLRCSGHESSFD
jgi:hypothetical protein